MKTRNENVYKIHALSYGTVIGNVAQSAAKIEIERLEPVKEYRTATIYRKNYTCYQTREEAAQKPNRRRLNGINRKQVSATRNRIK